LIFSNFDIDELKKLQPKLNTVGNRISGCFYLSASLSKGGNRKITICKDAQKANYLSDCFYLDIIFHKDKSHQNYPVSVYETSSKLLSWKENIPPEYWHVNPDNTLCLGVKEQILKIQSSKTPAHFINTLLSHYFYYMSYVKLKGSEPWKGHYHGLFCILEIASHKEINDKLLRELKLLIDPDIENWNKLLNKTEENKLKSSAICPFCYGKKKLVKNCKPHKKQIQGYNNLVDYLSK
jgi:hypothetical protein